MKKIIFLFIGAALILSTAKAQDTSGIIKVNPIGLAFGNINVAYEMPLSEKNSLQFGANMWNFRLLGITGFGLSAEYRFYFSKTTSAPEGLFVAPIGLLNSWSYQSSDSTTETSIGFGGGVKGGYQWVWDSGIALDLFAGYAYQVANFDTYNWAYGRPLFGAAVGYAF